MIEQQIEKLRTLQESYDAVATAIETQLPAISDKIDNIDLTPIENKVDEGVSALSTKIENIDLSSVAKQGENAEATNSKILEEVQKIPNLKNIYSARFEKNDDNINTYTMILPIIAGVEGDTIIL